MKREAKFDRLLGVVTVTERERASSCVVLGKKVYIPMGADAGSKVFQPPSGPQTLQS